MECSKIMTVMVITTTMVLSISSLPFFSDVVSGGVFDSKSGDYVSIEYDEDEMEEIAPVLLFSDGYEKRPEYVFGRIADTGDYKVAEYFVYYPFQTTDWGGSHVDDYEFVMVWYTDGENGSYNIDKIAYDEYHYVIGREKDVKVYDDFDDGNLSNDFVLEVADDYHAFDYCDDSYSDINSSDYEVYNDYDVRFMSEHVLLRSEEKIGFNSELMNQPSLVWDKGTFGYKEHNAWDSWWRSIYVSFKDKLGDNNGY